MDNQNSNLEFLPNVLEIVEWMNGGTMGDWSETPGNLIITKLQKDVSFAQFRVERVEEELSELKRDKKLLIQKLGEQETEIDKLRKELEREKWETCDAKVNTKEMAKEVAKLYWKIGDLVDKISTGDVGEEGDHMQLIDDEEEGPMRKRNKWDVGEDGGEFATKEALHLVRSQVENKMTKMEKDRNETKLELARTNQFVENINTLVLERIQKPKSESSNQISQEFLPLEKSSPTISIQEAIALSILEPHQVVNDSGTSSPLNSNQSQFPMVNVESGSLILDQLRKEEEEASTLTLTFHRSSPSPPNIEYPPQQVEFFHKLLGFPENIPETQATTVTSPKIFPMVRELVASPATSTASMISAPSPQASQIPDATKAEEEEETKEIYHAADPSKRYLGYFCLCGLECSTKKTLQFHLQYLQSNTSSSSSNGTLETDTIAQINMIPVHYHPPQNEPRTTMKIKKCKRCGDSYTGGKEGLRQHNLLHHNYRSQQPYSSPPANDVIPQPHTGFTCTYCPEIFRTMVQLRLHHKVKHTPSNSNQLNHLSTGYLNE